MQRRTHAGLKRLNHWHLELRATETESAQSSASVVDASPGPSTSTALASSLPPKSVPALATVLSVIGAAIILGIAICLYKRNQRRKERTSPNALAGKVMVEREYQYHSEKHIDLSDVSIYTEKPEKAVLTPRSFDDSDGKWVPQIKPYPATNVSLPEPAASPKGKSHKVQLSVKTTPITPLSPPPSYLLSNRMSGEAQSQSPQVINIPIPPSPTTLTHNLPPPTPPANRRKKTSFTSLVEQPVPAPSPRSESFAPQDLAPYPSSTDEATHKLPRLMTVSSSFTPTLDDELAIKLGDTVRMLDEYKDGWCLVQRVGRIDAPKGAVPRFCLQERRGVVPLLPNRKYSNGSLPTQPSTWR
ncbi:hypothetical protein H0H92_004542 [Tricholoma furcatifolium]|nr:hypothetical protein H0H92_004542 [Tricholoma furcatifolium]